MSWRRVGTRIDISADRVINDSFGGISGTLRLQIWATTSPYFGGSISGYILGTRSLGQLEGGYQFTGVSGSVPFRAPPAGNYYTTMTLEEYTVNGYVIVDYTTFDGTSSFGGVAGGGGGGGGFNGDLSIGGFVSWASRGSRVTFTVGDISNDRDSGRSGSLRLRLWATTSPYDGGSIFGYVLGTKKLKPLYGNQYYSSLVQPTTFRRPRSGYYFTTLTLEEFTSDGWVIVDYVTFPGLTRF
ncbi:MAG TPA: hypothetical protein VNT99_12150 [Methylomirabilota bacterium]|nr:hypothetical protein [Methylomirabilota bacterium]